MLKHFQDRKSPALKITLAVILGIISISMVITLVPGALGQFSNSPDTVATVGGEKITQQQMHQLFVEGTRGQNVPPQFEQIYAQQLLNQLIFDHALELEAARLGVSVTPSEITDRIKQIVPAAFKDGNWVGADQYQAMVQQETNLSVPEFEGQVRDMLTQEKVRGIVTDGITVLPQEIEQEFRLRNDKVKLDFVALKPADLALTINPSDQDLAAYFVKNTSKYQMPERRSADYALLDQAQIQKMASVSDADVQSYYKAHLDDYKVPDRVHVEHILFKTVGKTDAEIAEIQKQAQDVLKKAKSGANFEDLAKENSDDTSKDKGGDIGWIVRGQTVPEFEKAAFSMQPGSISDLVKTEYGFHIIKVLEREQAHTKPLDEVRLTILTTLSDQKTSEVTDELFNKIASALRQSNRQKLSDIAKQFNMTLGETQLADATQPVGDFGTAKELQDTLFHLRPGELSSPLRVDKGILVISLKEDQPAHAATLADVRDKVLADYRNEQSVQLARTKAQDLAKRVHDGASLADAAKALGLTVSSTDEFSLETPTVKDIGDVKQLAPAFKMQVGQSSPSPVLIGQNWYVYTVAEHQQPNMQDLPAQKADIQKALLTSKREMAYDAFHEALIDRLTKEGKIVINQDTLKKMSTPGRS